MENTLKRCINCNKYVAEKSPENNLGLCLNHIYEKLTLEPLKSIKIVGAMADDKRAYELKDISLLDTFILSLAEACAFGLEELLEFHKEPIIHIDNLEGMEYNGIIAYRHLGESENYYTYLKLIRDFGGEVLFNDECK